MSTAEILSVLNLIVTEYHNRLQSALDSLDEMQAQRDALAEVLGNKINLADTNGHPMDVSKDDWLTWAADRAMKNAREA